MDDDGRVRSQVPDPSDPDDAVACSLSAAERVGDGLVWLRYAVDGS